jgi:hypothetical protein
MIHTNFTTHTPFVRVSNAMKPLEFRLVCNRPITKQAAIRYADNDIQSSKSLFGDVMLDLAGILYKEDRFEEALDKIHGSSADSQLHAGSCLSHFSLLLSS